MTVVEILRDPWPWYVAGPLIGLFVPLLLMFDNKHFGISANLRHMCALYPGKCSFFSYDWRKESWNLLFLMGIVLGGFVGASLLANPEALHVATKTSLELEALGVSVTGSFMPESLFSWASLLTLQGFVLMVGGGFLVGFGARYAGGCTSGHAIMGLGELQLPSLVAVIGFFAGGLIMAHLIFPLILRL